MRVIIVPEPGRIEFAEAPMPAVGAYEALVEILTCSICSGTDSHIINDQFPMRDYPCILGHESIGRVIEVGAKVRNFKPGDLVLRPVAVRPGHKLGGYGSLFGGFAEYGIVADATAIIAETPRGQRPALPAFAAAQQIVPEDFNPNHAGAFITFKETLNFLYRLGVQPGKSLLILGSGTVGLNFTLGAKLIGAYPVITTGRRPEPLQQALAFGADAVINTAQEDLNKAVRALTNGAGVHHAVEAIGDWNVLQQGIRALADNGEIGIYGVAPDKVANMDFAGTAPSWALRFVQPKEEDVHAQVLSQAAQGFIQLERLISHVLPWEDVQQGFELVWRKEALKVVLTIRS